MSSFWMETDEYLVHADEPKSIKYEVYYEGKKLDDVRAVVRILKPTKLETMVPEKPEIEVVENED